MLIAEIGLAHEGSLGLAMSYARAVRDLGLKTCKYQMHLADVESSNHEKFRIPFSSQDISRQEYWRRTEFTFSEWKILKEYCDELGLEFLCSPFSITAVDWLEALGVERYKLGSAEATCPIMLKRISETNKPVIVSTGLSNEKNIIQSIDLIGRESLMLLYCVSSYPSSPEQIDLGMMSKMKSKYNVSVGLSDHSGNPLTSLLALHYGADAIEFHVAFDKRQFGPDTQASLDLQQIEFIMKNKNFINLLTAESVKNDSKDYLSSIFSRSISLKTSMKKGEVIQIENLEIKKPGGRGINNFDYKSVIGKRLNRTLKVNSFLRMEDLSD